MTLATHAQPKRADTELVPRFILERMLREWKSIEDYQAVITLTERRADRGTDRFSIFLQVVQDVNPSGTPQNTLRMNVYDRPIPSDPKQAAEIENATPMEIYFINPLQHFYHYQARTQTVTIDLIQENNALPQFLKLAGFLTLDLAELEKRVQLDRKAELVEQEGKELYRIMIEPRADYAPVAPNRFVWIERDTNLPYKFLQDGDQLTQTFIIEDYVTNQGIRADSLTPMLPANTQPIDLRPERRRVRPATP